MYPDWRQVNLGELLRFSNGKTSPPRSDDLPYPVYGSNGKIGSSSERNAPSGTIVIGRVGSYCGSLHFSDDACWVTDNAIIANAHDGNNARFLFYLLQSLHLNDWRSGSGQPLLNQTILSSILTKVPSLKEQQAIAHILGTLDDKIELNRRMNRTLEAMAQAIFQDWFVHFGPTRAKMKDQEPYLPSALWDLFPDELVDSELGEIPEGWQVSELGKVATFPVRAVKPQELSVETAYIGLDHMPRKSIAIDVWENSGKVTSNKLSFKRGEFLFGKLRPYFHKVGLAPTDGICSTDIVVVSPKKRLWSSFVLMCISTDEFVSYTDQTSNGTKMPRASWKTMGQYEVCLPPDSVAQAFQYTSQDFLNRIGTNVHESLVLRKQRDTLLPHVLSVEVTDKERETSHAL